MPEAVIVATARTPIGRANKGSLVDARPDDLSAFILADVMGKVPASTADEVEDVIWGIGQPGGEGGYNIARVISAMQGLDDPRRHGQPLLLVVAADHPHGGPRHQGRRGRLLRRRWRRDRQPLHVRRSRHRPPQRAVRRRRSAHRRARTGGEDGPGPPAEGVPDIYIAMGQTAENVVEATGISRERQDEWGVSSQNRAEAAQDRGFFEREITPYTLPDGTVVSKDDGIRAGTTLEKVSQLKPVFRPDGTVTAGNACPLNDGAAAVVVMSDTKAKATGHRADRPHHLLAASRPSTQRSWASARSTPAGRPWPVPA